MACNEKHIVNHTDFLIQPTWLYQTCNPTLVSDKPTSTAYRKSQISHLFKIPMFDSLLLCRRFLNRQYLPGFIVMQNE